MRLEAASALETRAVSVKKGHPCNNVPPLSHELQLRQVFRELLWGALGRSCSRSRFSAEGRGNTVHEHGE